MPRQERLRALGAAAAIGTDRVGGDLAAADELLTEAAKVGIQSRAGWRPPELGTALPECPSDEQPVAPRAAVATLARLLDTSDDALIEEWIELARAHGVVVDAGTLPLVLDWSVRQSRQSESVVAVLGQRGPWLAALNPEWRAFGVLPHVPGDAEELWQTGRSSERQSLLAAVRRRDPDRARSLVEATWPTDSATDRETFLEQLVENRSTADEPLLERALDDRSKIVRRRAAAILAIIPGSQLRARMSAVAKRVITVDAPAGSSTRKRRRIVIEPPQSFDPAWTRDAIDERPPEGIGPRAWWLRQILARADLSVWQACTGLEPEAVLASLESTDYRTDCILALMTAARSMGDAAWITALVGSVVKEPTIDLPALTALMQPLPDERREALILDVLRTTTLDPLDRWSFLSAFDRPWSASFSDAAMTLAAAERPAGPNEWRLPRLIDAVAARISPDAVSAFEQALAATFPGGQSGVVLNSLERVRLRAGMRKEFRS